MATKSLADVAEDVSNGSKELSAADILNANDEVIEKVDVPEWGGHVYVRSLTGHERDAFEESIIEGRGKNRNVNMRNLRAKLVAAATVDSNKKRLFDAAQVDALGKKNSRALDRVFEKAQELSGLRDEDVEELTKELGKDQNGSSGSDSPLH